MDASKRKELYKLAGLAAIFLFFFYLPVESERLRGAIVESLALAKEYAREHVLLCLVPAFFIAGAIATFVSQVSVMKYLGPKANKVLAYSVASVSGTILAVCSCTVLPLFAGIYRAGAGLGPACAFLYAGPAINVLAIILTARILGVEMGIARAVAAIVFSIVIGLGMHFVFRKEELAKIDMQPICDEEPARALWKEVLYFASMVAFLVFANWAKPAEEVGVWFAIYKAKWTLAGVSLVVLAATVCMWFKKEELGEWVGSTWGYSKQILPLLFAGVLVAGLLLGRPEHEGVIPSQWVNRAVGGNSIWANLFAAVAGAFMYFATLTEVPILEGLLGSGMGKGPALSLLLAGPALSLPNMLVIHSIMGIKKTFTFVVLVVLIATLSGILYGSFF